MAPSRACTIVLGVVGVIAIVPVVGMIGLLVCEWRRTTFPAVYFKLCPHEPIAFAHAMIPILAINLFSFITALPVLIAFKYVYIANGLIFLGSGIAIITIESMRLTVTEGGLCEEAGHNATSIFKDLFTDDINTEAYYDVLEMMYLMSTHGKYRLADAAGPWVAKLCMVDRSFFAMFFGMAMVAYASFLGYVVIMVYAPSWRDLILNSEYRRIDGEVIHETIDISR